MIAIVATVRVSVAALSDRGRAAGALVTTSTPACAYVHNNYFRIKTGWFSFGRIRWEGPSNAEVFGGVWLRFYKMDQFICAHVGFAEPHLFLILPRHDSGTSKWQ